ncbi:putative type II secretion system protein HxcR [bioreactor metagenome]|uniref:Putative type II secretion system protein HxcR n=1 Tax=bioreactor metagenome TaxID=1076179 RepID=A0A645JEU7_9ZZZZ
MESNKSLIGCPSCGGTGFSGRIGVFECLYVSNAIRKLLFQETPVQFIREQAHKEGMESLLEDGIQKVRKGLTTMKEIASLSSDMPMPMPNEVLN